MPSNALSTDTCWSAAIAPPTFAPLRRDLTTDVLIIGAGITGLTAAYLLAQRGRQVTIIDAGDVWSGETSCTTAHITEEMDFGYADIAKLHGEQTAQRVFESQRAARRFIETTVKELRIECQWQSVDGYLFLDSTHTPDTLDKELEVLHRIGWPNVELLLKAPAASFDTGPCLRFPDQAQFHPLQYLAGLTAYIVKQGGQFFTQTQAEHIAPHTVTTADGHTITAKTILVATHSPVKNVLFFLKEAAYRTYVIAAEVPAASMTHALYCDTAEPYHYVRLTKKNEAKDLLIVGGEDHKTGQANNAEERFANLERWARARFPVMGPIEYRWSGQIIEPVDRLPYIGKSPYHQDIYIATGYSGNGMTSGTLAALVLTNLACGMPNAWEDLYNPTRKNARSGIEFLAENANMVQHLVGDRLKSASRSADELAPGEGAIVQRGLHKIAAYRNADGRLTECSATCPHLGCVVQWNAAEQSFDCPCHGSRFTKHGKVLTGPATRDLAPMPRADGTPPTSQKPA